MVPLRAEEETELELLNSSRRFYTRRDSLTLRTRSSIVITGEARKKRQKEHPILSWLVPVCYVSENVANRILIIDKS